MTTFRFVVLALLLVASSRSVNAIPITYTFNTSGTAQSGLGTELPGQFYEDIEFRFEGDTANVDDGVIRNLNGTVRLGNVVAALDSPATIALTPQIETMLTRLAFFQPPEIVPTPVQADVVLSGVFSGQGVGSLVVAYYRPNPRDEITSAVADYDLKSDFEISGFHGGWAQSGIYYGQGSIPLDFRFVQVSTDLGPLNLINSRFPVTFSATLQEPASANPVPEPSGMIVWISLISIAGIATYRRRNH